MTAETETLEARIAGVLGWAKTAKGAYAPWVVDAEGSWRHLYGLPNPDAWETVGLLVERVAEQLELTMWDVLMDALQRTPGNASPRAVCAALVTMAEGEA